MELDGDGPGQRDGKKKGRQWRSNRPRPSLRLDLPHSWWGLELPAPSLTAPRSSSPPGGVLCRAHLRPSAVGRFRTLRGPQGYGRSFPVLQGAREQLTWTRPMIETPYPRWKAKLRAPDNVPPLHLLNDPHGRRQHPSCPGPRSGLIVQPSRTVVGQIWATLTLLEGMP